MLFKKIKIQIPTSEHIFKHSAICSAIGSLFVLPLGNDIFIGTLCSSLVLLINLQFWIWIVARLIRMVQGSAIAVESNDSGFEEQRLKKQADVKKSDELVEIHNDDHTEISDQNTAMKYIPNTAGMHVFFFLKLTLLMSLLIGCAFIFSPICIIFSNTIIVFSLLSSSVWVI
jgi:hypothetical protein